MKKIIALLVVILICVILPIIIWGIATACPIHRMLYICGMSSICVIGCSIAYVCVLRVITWSISDDNN